jgi:hypothetical protein
MASEILSNLFVGTREDAEALGTAVPADWTCIAVTEYRARYGRKEELPHEPNGSIDMPFMRSGKADPVILDAIAETIWRSLLHGKKTLVHCVHAHERSPLAIAWYLVWAGLAPTIEVAYAAIVRVHPSTERRDRWLTTQPTCHSEAINETARLREALRYLRREIPGYDDVFASCGFEEFKG